MAVSQPMEPRVGAHLSQERTSQQTSCYPGVGGDSRSMGITRNNSKFSLLVNCSWCLLWDLSAHMDGVGTGGVAGQ